MVNKDYQNSLVGIVLSSDIRSNAKQNLADLHWLHVRARIHYKIALLTFKSITTHRPTYLSDLLQFRTTSRRLRSSDHCLLHNAGARTVFGSGAFCHAAPTIWVELSIPADLTDNFKNFYLVLNAASKRTTNFHKWCTRLRFFSLNLTYGALPAAWFIHPSIHVYSQKIHRGP